MSKDWEKTKGWGKGFRRVAQQESQLLLDL